jgi:hypothetical protein
LAFFTQYRGGVFLVHLTSFDLLKFLPVFLLLAFLVIVKIRQDRSREPVDDLTLWFVAISLLVLLVLFTTVLNVTDTLHSIPTIVFLALAFVANLFLFVREPLPPAGAPNRTAVAGRRWTLLAGMLLSLGTVAHWIVEHPHGVWSTPPLHVQ